VTQEDSFVSSLADVDVSVIQTDTTDIQLVVENSTTDPAVGVSLDEIFNDPAFSLASTSVTVDPTPAALLDAKTGVTGAKIGVGDYGSLSLSMTDQASELISLFVEKHVAILRSEDIVGDMRTALESLADDFAQSRSSTIIATGPSATADMGSLVKGAHGPKEVHVVIVGEER